jgi:hypothetical protein
MFFTSVNARLNTFDHGMPHPFKDRGPIVNSLSGIKNAIVKSLFVFIWNSILEVLRTITDKDLNHKGREHSGFVPLKLFADI